MLSWVLKVIRLFRKNLISTGQMQIVFFFYHQCPQQLTTSSRAVTWVHASNTKIKIFVSICISSFLWPYTCASTKEKDRATLGGHEKNGKCFFLQLWRCILNKVTIKLWPQKYSSLAFPLGWFKCLSSEYVVCCESQLKSLALLHLILRKVLGPNSELWIPSPENVPGCQAPKHWASGFPGTLSEPKPCNNCASPPQLLLMWEWIQPWHTCVTKLQEQS